MLNPIFWKKIQEQKHPGRWGIAEHQIPSIKVLFKTNAKIDIIKRYVWGIYFDDIIVISIAI